MYVLSYLLLLNYYCKIINQNSFARCLIQCSTLLFCYGLTLSSIKTMYSHNNTYYIIKKNIPFKNTAHVIPERQNKIKGIFVSKINRVLHVLQMPRTFKDFAVFSEMPHVQQTIQMNER